MQIGKISPSAAIAYKGVNNDSINKSEQVKSIQRQIEELQKQLQILSSKKEMSYEEKMKKRKELQLHIQNLIKKMEQQKMQIQQEKRAEKLKVEKGSEVKGGLVKGQREDINEVQGALIGEKT